MPENQFASRGGARPRAPRRQRHANVQSPRRAPRRRVILVGHTLCANEWLDATLNEKSYAAARYPDPSQLLAAYVNDDVTVLLDASRAARQASLALLRRLSVKQRQRTLMIGWSIDEGVIRQFIEAGAADFLKLPASATELLLRLELRSAAAYDSVGRPNTGPPALPRADPVTGIIGAPAHGVRLSQRELFLYSLLAERLGQPVRREEILRVAWQRDQRSTTSSNVVDVYIRYLRVKLARVAPHLRIVSIRHVGYALEIAGKPRAQD